VRAGVGAPAAVCASSSDCAHGRWASASGFPSPNLPPLALASLRLGMVGALISKMVLFGSGSGLYGWSMHQQGFTSAPALACMKL
jgi:hypothetical protein